MAQGTQRGQGQGQRPGQGGQRQQGQGRKPFHKKPQEKPEFDQQIQDLARVTRVTKGGKQLSFRACVLIGDRKGRVGYGVEKGKDVQIAVEKAVNQAKKNIMTIPIINDTIPHRVLAKFKAAEVMLKPAHRGSGIIAGGSIRSVLELAGVPNASSKMLGRTSNKITNIKAVFEALSQFRPDAVRKARLLEKARDQRDQDKLTATEVQKTVAPQEDKQQPKRAPRAVAKKKKDVEAAK